MEYTSYYPTPIGALRLQSDGTSLVACDFTGPTPPPTTSTLTPQSSTPTAQSVPTQSVATSPELLEPPESPESATLPPFQAAREWLDEYFAGGQPSIEALPLNPTGTAFRQLVWQELRAIPYGTFVTYGMIAKNIARHMGKPAMSNRAVGGALSKNPLPIIVPCHRVIGTNGKLTGYSGGMDRKIWLLRHEGVSLSGMSLPDGTRFGAED